MKILNRKQMITLQCATMFVHNGRITGILETSAPSIREAREKLIKAAAEIGMKTGHFELITERRSK